MIDPPVRKDGRCAGRGCKKRLNADTVKERDPFCSTACCRRHHGVRGHFVQTGHKAAA